MERFYRPFLDEIIRYDRLAGYLSLRSLAHALEGVDSLLETDGTVRVIAGADLQKREKGAMFPDADEPLAPWVESQLTIIATLLDRGDLKIKVGDPKGGDGLFHPKLGIGVDREGNKISFEGSINETLSAWQYNYERFKVHRSWSRGEAKYVEEDVSTFNALWNGFHPQSTSSSLTKLHARTSSTGRTQTARSRNTSNASRITTPRRRFPKTIPPALSQSPDEHQEGSILQRKSALSRPGPTKERSPIQQSVSIRITSYSVTRLASAKPSKQA
ncbi:hypothetical protein ACFQL1_25600 [Halomicroarcula sp. GCM10025709]|uniref:hypothetical protein n=1 Tax=Halomicroarcula sp. GCM10025709 TaxID=3252669 RepID=UPI003618EDE1